MKNTLVVLTFGILLCGCGGGGGGGSDAPSFEGVWRGSVGVVSDECNILAILNEPDTLTFTHTVNQDNERVVLDVLGGGSFAGVVDPAKDSFQVAQTSTTSDGCISTTEIAYLHASDDDHATVGVSLEVKCPTSDCTITWVGQGTRDH